MANTWQGWLSTRRPLMNSKLQDGPVAFNPLLFYASPLQLWLDRLVAMVNKTGTMETDWLPVFTIATSHLRSVFARGRIQSHHRTKAIFLFLCQWETGGMLALGLIFTASTLGAPLVLRELLKDTQNMTVAWLLVAANVVATLSGRAKNQVVRTQSAWAEAMLKTSIFEKSLRLSPAARIAHPPAQIINMSAVDVDFVATYVLMIHDVWVAPLQIIIIVILAFSIIGPSALVGFFLLAVMLLGQSMASKLTRSAVVKYIRLNDQRLALLRELLTNVKAVKAAAYEFLFRGRVSEARDQQLKALWAYLSMSMAFFTAINRSVPNFTAAAAFLVYYLTGHQLAAAEVFPALAYFKLLGEPVYFASMAVTRQAAVLPSIQRIMALLAAEESGPVVRSYSAGDPKAAIEFKNASFVYSSYKDDPAQSWRLDVGDLVIPRNKLTAVIGPTGSGKSSLLQAVLGEMMVNGGSFDVYGKIAYVAQDAWIMSGTLRDNIVFMGEFDLIRYQAVVQMCCLEEEFRTFPGDDQFLVGEAGGNLSGGQRARISLARALYSKPQILLLDDPLSAVDARVRQLLFQTLRSLSITVILVTLHTSFVPQVDHVVVMEKSRVVRSGTELLADSNLKESVLHEDWLREAHASESSENRTNADKKSTPNKLPEETGEESATAVLDLVQKEERATGAVKFGVLAFYIRAAGGAFQATSILLLVALLTACKVIAGYWFVWWISDELGLKQGQYLGGYLGLTITQSVFIALVSLSLIYCTLRASKGIHATIVDNLLSAPMSYFQRQPTGRILNRLSSDIEALDTGMIKAVNIALGSLTNLLSSLCLITLSSPIVVVAVIPYILVTGYYQVRFRVCAREVQRSSSILQSPATAILSESLTAPASIKAYNGIMFMVSKHGAALDQLMSAQIVKKSLDTWITLRAEMAAVMLLLVVAMLTARGQIPDVLGGLALTFATGLANDVFLLAWGMTDLEVQMNSIERLHEYHENLPKEGQLPSLQVESKPAPKDWPRKNSIDIKNMSLIYPTRSTPALDNITLHVESGERLGIVGRTGCGKSTLVSSIARLVDPTSGSISIGGVETTHITPQRLRAAVHTLPQEPLIFEGTVRDNLDPKSEHADSEILHILEQCRLTATLTDNDDDAAAPTANAASTSFLGKVLSTGGTGLSAGQRQLLCAVRALLTRPPVLLVDEAAANVDHETDDALQRALRAMLPGSTTVMVIAHRAASLAWLDRILVMDAGRVVEEGSPAVLLEREGSYYRTAVRAEGEKAFEAALVVAKERRLGTPL